MLVQTIKHTPFIDKTTIIIHNKICVIFHDDVMTCERVSLYWTFLRGSAGDRWILVYKGFEMLIMGAFFAISVIKLSKNSRTGGDRSRQYSNKMSQLCHYNSDLWHTRHHHPVISYCLFDLKVYNHLKKINIALSGVCYQKPLFPASNVSYIYVTVEWLKYHLEAKVIFY